MCRPEQKLLPAPLFPATTKGCSTGCTRGEDALCMGTPGMLAALAKIPGQLAGSIDNLFLAGDYMGIPSVNGALSSGHRSAREAADLLARRRN